MVNKNNNVKNHKLLVQEIFLNRKLTHFLLIDG